MNLNTSKQLRQQVYQCYERSADALFELGDALSSEAEARSLPELSLSPWFRLTWANVYETLEDGRIDEQRWMTVWQGTPRKDEDLDHRQSPRDPGEPDASWKGTDWRGNELLVQAWKRLHFRQAREVEVTVFRVLRDQARNTKRDPRESWFIWVGEQELTLSEVAMSYRLRFSHEHSYRFLKAAPDHAGSQASCRSRCVKRRQVPSGGGHRLEPGGI